MAELINLVKIAEDLEKLWWGVGPSEVNAKKSTFLYI